MMGMTFASKPTAQPDALLVDPPVGSTLGSGVMNIQPEDVLLDDPEPTETGWMDQLPPRTSFASWSSYATDDPPISPNRICHEESKRNLKEFMALVDQNRTAFRQYVRQERGEEDPSMMARMASLARGLVGH
eukprot:Skav231366  [mRNA]  locus=scaffold1586:496938:499606:+ [translate_table: standard]